RRASLRYQVRYFRQDPKGTGHVWVTTPELPWVDVEGVDYPPLSANGNECIWNFSDENMKKSRGETLSRMRKLIKKADPDVVEDWKWMGTPLWSHDGRVSEGSGPSLQLESRRKRTPRDRHPEGEEVDESAFKVLVGQAVALN